VKNLHFLRFAFLIGAFAFSEVRARTAPIRYDLDFRLDEIKPVLQGQLKISFPTKSYAVRDTLWVHIAANAFSSSNTALAKANLDKRNELLRMQNGRYGGKMDRFSFTVNEIPAAWGYAGYGKELIYVVIPHGEINNEFLTLATPFRLVLPSEKAGVLGTGRGSISAVHGYPRLLSAAETGLHFKPYTDQGRRAYPAADYSVKINLPSDYVVAAGSTPVNPSAQDFITSRKLHADSLRSVKKLPYQPTPGSKERRDWHFELYSVTDLAWFAKSLHWVNTDTLRLPSGKEISILGMNHPQYRKLWEPAARYAKKALLYYSARFGDYPYSTLTLTDGVNYAGADRAYPGVAVLGYKRSRLDLEDIIAKLIAHSWTSLRNGTDGIGEPWLSDGLAAYMHRAYLRDQKPNFNGLPIPVLPVLGLRFLRRSDLDHIPYLYKVRRGNDHPPGMEASYYSDNNYGISVKGHNALLFQYLEAYLGADSFAVYLRDFWRKNENKPLQGMDLQLHLEARSGKNLNWFFTDLLTQEGYLDYQVVKVSKAENPETGKTETAVFIRNRGTVAAPFPVSVFMQESDSSVQVWVDGFLGEQPFFMPIRKMETVCIDRNTVMPEINRKNNVYRTGEVIPTLEKLRFNFIMGPPEMNTRNQVFYLPVTLWNNYNKSMAGFAIHNKTPVRKKFEYLFAPMVSLNPIGFAGVGIISGNIPTPRSRLVESYSYKLAYVRFAYFFDTEARDWNRIMPKLMLNFRPKNPRSEQKMQLYARSIFNLLESTDLYRSAYGESALAFQVTEAGFSMFDTRMEHPYRFLVWAEYISDLTRYDKPNVNPGSAVKLSLEYRQKINYISAAKGLDIRFFAGTFLGQPNTVLDYRYRLSGHPGFWDYKFDNYYLGRAETRGLSSRQFFEYDGGFKVLTPLGQTDRWMLALNLKASLPGPIPIKPYLDVGLYRQVTKVVNTGELIKEVTFSYSGGLMVSIINDVLEVFIPLYHSKDIRDYLAFTNSKWHQQIRFRLNMQELNPRRIREKLEWLPR
jgi:hypothetical protein